MPRRRVTVASAIFFALGPGLEAGVGPLLLTGFWDRGDGFSAQPLWTVIGVALILGGLAVVVPAFVAFATEGRGTPTPAAPTSRLVVSGAYRHVRNPMYVATAAVIVGEALVLARPILLVAAAAYLATLATTARLWEEPALRARFGAEYDAYAAAVPAWWPRRTPWSAGGPASS